MRKPRPLWNHIYFLFHYFFIAGLKKCDTLIVMVVYPTHTVTEIFLSVSKHHLSSSLGDVTSAYTNSKWLNYLLQKRQ